MTFGSHVICWRALGRGAAFGGLLVVAAACSDTPGTTNPVGEVTCNLDTDLLITSLGPNQIPAISAPDMVAPDAPEASYLFDADRVLGVVINGEARAYPHNILWHHEIVNDVIDGELVSVSFCPLTGSGLAFRPQVGTRTLDLGVSGLLFANNLVMYDRLTGEVYGPQLAVEGLCQGFVGSSLELMPLQEMSWGRWKEMYPDTKVVSGELGFGRNYRFYPYGGYDNVNSSELLFPMSVDQSRPLKERVLAIRSGTGGRGYPFGELEAMGDQVAINELVAGVPTAIFYENGDGQTALAFDARVDGQTLTFDVGGPGSWVDAETQSTWSLDGTAIGGPLLGSRMETLSNAYTLFWFAWRHFQPTGDTFLAP